MKISIITRARNRLEYTIRCVDAVVRNTHEKDYEHIIVNQASSDGTHEWLEHIARHSGECFSRVRALHLDRNTGDWGGMLVGLQYARGKYLVQLDNDIEMPDGWDGVLMDVLERSKYGAAVLSLKGCGANPMAVTTTETMTRPDGTVLTIGPRDMVTACYMCRTEEVRRITSTYRIANCRHLTRCIPGGSCRVMGIYAREMDGGDTGDESHLNRRRFLHQKKYPRDDPEFWEKLL